MFDLLQRMDGGQVLGFFAILSAAVVLCLLILTVGWASTTATKQQAALKREMLARGMSVEEIERLSMSENERLARIGSDQKVREAQAAADLKRDLVARGVPIEQIMQLTPEGLSAGTDAGVLADTICAMVSADGTLDREAVARLIEAFMKRGAAPAPMHLETYLAGNRQPAKGNEGARPEK